MLQTHVTFWGQNGALMLITGSATLTLHNYNSSFCSLVPLRNQPSILSILLVQRVLNLNHEMIVTCDLPWYNISNLITFSLWKPESLQLVPHWAEQKKMPIHLIGIIVNSHLCIKEWAYLTNDATALHLITKAGINQIWSAILVVFR